MTPRLGGVVRVGEMDDALGKEFAARRDSMSSELNRLGARLAEGGKEATAPAVRLADTVRISPEARAAQFSQRSAELPLLPFPSPVDLVAALKDLASASTPAAAAELTEQITTLIRRIAQSFPGAAPIPATSPADDVAAALVRAVLATPPNAGPSGPGTPAFRPEQVANLVRQLFAALSLTSAASTPGVVTPSTAERAAVTILLAIVRNGGGEQPVPQPPAAQQPGAFPAALLGILAGAVPPRPKNRERKRQAHLPSSPEDEEGSETPEGSRQQRG